MKRMQNTELCVNPDYFSKWKPEELETTHEMFHKKVPWKPQCMDMGLLTPAPSSSIE